MTYDLALYPAAGPGLGHLMRCYALAEAAVEMKAKVIVVVAQDAPAVVWPCPVLQCRQDGSVPLGHYGDGTCRITDGRIDVGGWAIIDGLPPKLEVSGRKGYIYPHFGAVPVAGFPTFVGPSWMPLRRALSIGRVPGNSYVGTLLYKAGPEVERAEFGLNGDRCVGLPDGGAADAADLMRECYRAVVPPSTIAYEALAMGLNVELLHVAFPGCEQVGQAMVDAGAAHWYGERGFLPVKSSIDGRGAIRLLEALL